VSDNSKIEWCDMTWNPVWGCGFKCPYCYARSISRRFGEKMGAPDFSEPTWIQRNFEKKFPRKPSRIFVNSMSDISHWKDEMLRKVNARIHESPEHTFIFLSKDPSVYFRPFPCNAIRGVTATTQNEIQVFISLIMRYAPYTGRMLLNIEPMCQPIVLTNEINKTFDWIIVGAETGYRKNRPKPESHWLTGKITTPLFLKDNMRPHFGDKIVDKFQQFL
jgi:protein gp37